MNIDPSKWRIKSVAKSTSRGLWDIEVTDGEHVIRFEACSDGGAQDPLAWAVEQVGAFDERSFRIACLHCPDKGDPPGPPPSDDDGEDD